MAELQKSHMPTASDINPMLEQMQQLTEWINNGLEESQMLKALDKNNVIQFPSKAAREGKDGMQSVWLDDNLVSTNGDYFEKPGQFQFEAMRLLVDQTPILAAVVQTRINQISRFCRPQENGRGLGFEIRTKVKDQHVTESQKKVIQVMTDFFTNCGFEKNPRERARLRRDDFMSFMRKATRDTLTMDSFGIETEFKRDRKAGMDGFYCVDGATIRLCTERGYRGDDEIRALQVVQGQLRAAYTFDDLIYVPRNPRSDVLVGGYGMSETEQLVKVVTNLLNAMTYNSKFFDSNSIPKGVLNLQGEYDQNDLAAFKRMWNGMVKGINNSWALPVLVSRDAASSAKFEKFGADVDEMMFSKWMVFLTSIVCAIYGIAPEEINFDSFSTKTGGIGNGADVTERLAQSKDKGLMPLLSYFENLFSDFILSDFTDELVFRFTGLDEEDEKQVFERKKLTMTVNEMRAENNMDRIEASWGDAPLNPSLMSAWQAEQQQGQEDYGNPQDQAQAQAPADQGGEGDPEQQDQQGQDFGDGGGDFGQPNQPDPQQEAAPAPDQPQMTKSFGLPVFVIEA